MKKSIRMTLALLLAVAMAFGLVSCSGAGSGAESGKTLTIGIYASTTFVGPFDPSGQWAGMSAGFGQNYLVYDQLYVINTKGEYVSRIVEDAAWPDDTTLVLKLRDNIKFANGDQLTGADVLYSLDLAQNSGRRSGYYTAVNLDKSTVSDDGLTVTLIYNEVYAPYYGGLDFSIVDKKFIESNGGGDKMDWFDVKSLNGSGPYTVKEYVQDSYSIYEKKSDYWGAAYGYNDALSKITVKNFTDQTTLGVDLETGAIDLAIDLSNNDYDRLAAGSKANIKAQLIQGNVCYILAFDDENEILKNKKVREALCYAVDTAALTKAVAGSYGVAATSVFAEGEQFYSPGHSYTFDTAKAKALIQEAGYKDGEINLNIVMPSMEPYTGIAEALQASFATIGVNLKIDSLDFATFIQTQSTEGATAMQVYSMTGGNPFGEPHMHLDNWLKDSTCPCMSRNAEEPNTYIAAAVHTLDDGVRAENYKKLQDWWYDNYECIPLYEYLLGFAYNTDKIAELNLHSTSMVYLFDIVMK